MQMMANRILGLITARGGSKGIPRKNITDLAGKPLIAWTIEAAKNATLLSRTIVSTDDPEIADISRRWGAEVPFQRPAELSADNSPHAEVITHAIAALESLDGYQAEYVMLLQPTSPLRTAFDIDNACRIAFANKADAVFSVCSARTHPYLCKKVGPEGLLADFMEKPKGYLRRQDYPQVYALNGAIFLVKCELAREKGFWDTLKPIPYLMPEERSIDIDTEWDLYQVELVLRDQLAGD